MVNGCPVLVYVENVRVGGNTAPGSRINQHCRRFGVLDDRRDALLRILRIDRHIGSAGEHGSQLGDERIWVTR